MVKAGTFALALLGTGMILLGMLGNLLQNVKATGLSGTSFEEGATTFVVYGAVMVVAGGLLHWAPKLWGVVIAEKTVLPVVALMLIGTVLDELERRGGRYGLVTMCAAGGMAPAVIIERI